MWHTLHLGLVPYQEGLALQDHAAALVRAAPGEGFALVLQHPSVVTLGRRSSQGDLKAEESTVAAGGTGVVRIHRGGLATAHEPGQVVLYPVVSLTTLGLSARAFMIALETVLEDALKDLGAPVHRRDDHRGVFSQQGKLGFMGVSVRDNVTTHGVAVNVSNDLSAFRWIVPCGLTDTPLTTLRALGVNADEHAVAQALLNRLFAAFPLPHT